MNNVISLVQPEINQDALRAARELVEKIEHGDVIACGIIAVQRVRTVSTIVSASKAYHELNSGAARLAAILANMSDNGDPAP